MTLFPRHRAVCLTLLLMVCAVLGGCAAGSAYRDGQARAAQGDLAQALPRFEEALRLEPRSVEYRIAVARTRERLLAQQLTRADQALAQQQPLAAEQIYREVLAQVPGHERAQQGLRRVEHQRRIDQALPRAEAAAAAREWEQVRTLLRPLQLEAPPHRRVAELMQQAETALTQEPGSAAERALAAAYRKPISIEFRDTPLKTVFEVIARSSGLNFVFDKDVRTDQRASIFLKNSSIETAVNMLLVSNQLDQRVLDAHSVLIYPNTPAKQKEHQSLVVRSFYLANGDAKAMAASLKSLLKTREVVVDERLNLVVVRDTPEAVRLAARLVALHDLPDPEVMLEVEVLEIKRSRLFDLGVRWPDLLSLSPLPSGNGGTLTLADLANLSSTSTAAAVGSVGINARDTESDANILANPRIRARNREKARIHIGERVPIITATSTSSGFVAESVTYVDVGLKLDVEPSIYLDNEVAIKIALEVSSLVGEVKTEKSVAYRIGTRTATTVLRLKDGENQVLAGLISDEDRRTANKVPFLGDVPLLGRLFGNQADDTAKTEIVLSITPRVLRNVQRPDAAMQLFDSGSESAAGGGAATPAPAPAVPVPRPAATPSPSPIPSPSPATPPATNPTSTGSSTTSATGGAPVLVGGGTVTPAAVPVRLRWVAPASVRVGDTFSVQLLAGSDEPVTALGLQLVLDPQVVQLVSVLEGGFLRQGGAASTFNSRLDASTGQVSVNASRGGGSGASTEAVLLTLNLRALARPAEGQTQLQLASVAPLGSQGRALASQALTPALISVQP